MVDGAGKYCVYYGANKKANIQILNNSFKSRHFTNDQ